MQYFDAVLYLIHAFSFSVLFLITFVLFLTKVAVMELSVIPVSIRIYPGAEPY